MHCHVLFECGGSREREKKNNYASFQKEWMLKRDYDFEYRHGNNRLYISCLKRGREEITKCVRFDFCFSFFISLRWSGGKIIGELRVEICILN